MPTTGVIGWGCAAWTDFRPGRFARREVDRKNPADDRGLGVSWQRGSPRHRPERPRAGEKPARRFDAGVVKLPASGFDTTVINFNLILPDLYVGTCPQSTLDVKRLKTGPRITAILNLQTDADIRTLNIDWPRLEQFYLSQDLVLRRWPIRDFDPSHLETRLAGAAETAAQLLGAGHRLYVHCTAGVGRAPAVAIAVLACHQGWSLDDACTHVRGQRSCAPYLDIVDAVLRRQSSDTA